MKIYKIILYLLFFILLYAFLAEPNLITVKTINLKSDDIKNLKIVFLSDFHFSRFAPFRLKRLVNKVNALNPDIIISGGDYVIAHRASLSMDLDKMISALSKMKSKYGIYSVLGNHDYFRDSKIIIEKLRQYGITVLENSNTAINADGKPLFIAGISDMQTTYYSLDKALLNTKPPVILVSHSPDIFPEAKGRVNLILAGHTHGGQVRIPFWGALIVPSEYGKAFESGFIEKLMFVGRGIGTSFLHVRFNCPPEIVVINYI